MIDLYQSSFSALVGEFSKLIRFYAETESIVFCICLGSVGPEKLPPPPNSLEIIIQIIPTFENAENPGPNPLSSILSQTLFTIQNRRSKRSFVIRTNLAHLQGMKCV